MKSHKDLEKNINDYLEKALVNFDLPGVTVGVKVDTDSSLDHAGLDLELSKGKADIKTEEDLKPNLFSHMASVSKTFTACGILRLWEKGLLALDDKICELLPWLSIKDELFKDITVRHFITHTSGFPGVEDFHWTVPEIDSHALKRFAMSDDVKNANLVNIPGENKFSYSDMAYELLGNIIQEVTGTQYEEYIDDNFFKPLGMDTTTMLVFKRTEQSKIIDPDSADRNTIDKMMNIDNLLSSGLVIPHGKDPENHIVRQEYYPYTRRHAPSSTLNSNVSDLKKWGDAHMAKSVMEPNTYDQMWRTQTVVPNNGEGMGFGWFIREQNGYTLYGHEGMDDGFRASFWICPELKAQIIVLSNISKAPVKKINRTLFDMVCESI